MIDYEAAAKAHYKDLEVCSDALVEKVWSWESMEHKNHNTHGICDRCLFEETVKESRAGAEAVLDAALPDGDLYQITYPSEMSMDERVVCTLAAIADRLLGSNP